MIGRLAGRLLAKQAPEVLLDVNGVGYELQVPMSTFYELPSEGSDLALFTHLVVREDAQTLYGFATVTERALFRALIKVSGVGARLALTVLSGTSVDGFVDCVRHEDTASLIKLPGIGKKTAERLIVELRDSLLKHDLPGAGALPGLAAQESSPRNEAFSALLALGYKNAEVRRMLKDVETDDASAEDIIRQALKANA